MIRKIVRSYSFSEREVNEALVFWMKSQDLQRPQYVGETPCTKWMRCADDNSIKVEWTDEDQVEVST